MYSQDFIEGILDSYEAAMGSMLKNKYISEISVISQNGVNKIAEFNNTACEYDRSKTISDLFDELVQTIPDHVAVAYKDKKYTYKELDEISDRLGKYIASQGIGREDVVSILIPRCEYMAIAPMGVIKAGAAYQPLDPTYPKDRLMYMLEDSAARLLIADRELLPLVDGYQGPVLFTDEIMQLEDRDVELKKPGIHDLFILLYTSGSTGVPKGCMVEYGNITAFCHWYKKYYSVDFDSRVAAYASFGFDASMMDTYGAIANGAQLHIIPEEIRLDFLALQRYFEENGITHSFMTTQVRRQFALEMECKSLKHLSIGGEKLVPLDPPKDYNLYNAYGPTECTIFTTIFEIDKYYSNVPIGKALDNFKLYITDKFGHLLPYGACGELMISGLQVSRGYLNKPEKTAEVYTKNIYDATEGYEVLYHSGDVARYLPDGNIQIIGRKDSQVKIRGFRIELSEVEEVIRRYKGIKDATVVAFDEAGGGKYIAAYVVSDSEVDINGLNAFIKETKPAYMVPAVTMQIDEIPLNQNQKVNKKALPMPERKVAEIIPPQNETQQKLFDCIAELLGYTEFGITTDVYEAGLTSISAIKLNILISKAFDIVIKTSDIKSNPTIQLLEGFVKTAGKETTREIQENYPLTNTQEGIFIECTANMGSTIYNIPYLLKLDKKVDLDKLARAIDSTVAAHPYLKTRLFMSEEGEVLQKRDDALAYKTQIINGMNKETLVRPYMLFNEQLFRFEIYRTCDGNYLFLDIHHIIADGTSLGIIINDINRAYSGETLETEVYTSYDLALDNRDALAGETYKNAEDYYRSIFEKAGGSINFYPDKNGPVPTAELYHRETSEFTVQDVKAFCKKHGITENVFFISAFGITLGKYNFRKDAVFTTIYHGRNDSRLSDTVGMLVKTLPVYCDFSGSTEDCLNDVQQQLINSMNNDIYPFSQISHEFNIKADAMVIYQGDNFAFDNIGGEYAKEEPVQLNMAKAHVSISISIERNKFVFEIEYRGDMYNEETIQYLADNLEATADGILRECDPSDIRLMFEEETRMEDDPSHAGKTFVDLFREAVEKYPDRPAVRDGMGEITYKELDKMSDYVAQKLTENGFGREKAAGILCGRTKEFAVAYVGVMKAGGAYVPLDPEYLQSRIEYMLKDSGAENLLVINRYRSLVGFYDQNIISLDEVAEEAEDFELSVELTPPAPENLAYMIYTSGSTGKPKGVMLEQRNLLNLIEYILITRKLTLDDIVAEFASFCFDASVIDLFAPLTAGAVLYILPESIRKDAVAVGKFIKDEKITTATFPTQMGELVAELLDDAPALRFVTLGGEKFKYYRERTYQMINGYGPTENTVSSTEFWVDRQYDNIPIGKSQRNIRSYIVDENLNRLPVGASGELCHAGRQIARGYHNLPEKTASVFVENPFSVCEEDKRLYRTGDMVRMKGDGNIEYIGRIDSQVKIRGYRVELGEIEGAVLKHELVKGAAVTVVEKGGNKYITAYYTGESIPDDQLKTFLEPLIPDYMMPSFFVHIDELPITPGGKIDKKALPMPEITTAANADYVEPVTTVQRTLCEIFEKALGIEKVGIEDNFFEIGGSSLTASKVAVMCLSKNISIVYADIFKYPTIRELAAIVDNSEAFENSQSGNEFADYNYNRIQSVISGNVEENIDRVTKEQLGDIMITGATGFLGIHILKAYLDNYDGKVYCLVRKGKYESMEKRMMHMLMYYFDNPCQELFRDRIICVDGDITSKEQVEKFADYKFSTIINCAACVKHFAAGDVLEKINVHGVENLIEFCKNNGRRLIQISTVSVAGEGSDGVPPMSRVFCENDLYIGQNITNEYIRTKFLAERAVLEAVSAGLDGKIIRVGNLMSRNSDGEFQINFITNGFLRSLRGYKAVGKFPIGGMHEIAELSPIDCTALAVLRLVQTDRRFTVFHACNSHHIYMADLIYAMRNYGFDLDIVKDDEFENAVKEFAKNSEDSDVVSGLIAYTAHNENEIYTLDYSNRFTAQVLYRLDYKWPVTDDRYLESAIEALDRLAFFD
ncbi:MAG: amino acid adenylation domain-containing protein [Clostridia bacterium]|nr:amino acid adenylation domain-containing protein [Clostridia bacterium]